MKRLMETTVAAAILSLLAACGAAPIDEAPAAPSAAETHADGHSDDDHGDEHGEEAAATSLAPIVLAPYTVAIEHLGEIGDGHINLYIEGGEVAAVRVWIGDEAATNAFIGKAEWEDTHHCAHLEVSEVLPEDAQLWVELDTPDGAMLKGATPL